MTKKDTDIKSVPSAMSNLPTGSTPKLVRQVQDNAIAMLLPHIESLFSTCDDLFFDLSSRAASNSEQTLYFESMRELRVRKSGVIAQFQRAIEQSFADLNNPNPSPITEAQDTEQLSLVHEDEIEQKVAINSMARKARSTNQEALYQLSTRLDYLIPKGQVTEDNNPIDPQQLCQHFAKACEQLDINIKAKIILYKQFDRLAISKLASLYSNANDLLINAGVIPKLSRSINNPNKASKTKPVTPSATHNDAQQADSHEDYSHFDFQEFGQLLDTMRQLGMHLIPNYQAYSHNPGPQMSNDELLAAITLLQLQQPSADLSSDPQNPGLGIREVINGALKEADPEKPQSVKKSDEDVINLVAMFFDFVLDDSNLPTAFQALIGRLQIPILKLALKDQSFFKNNKHPARKMVNALATASIGWDDVDSTEKDRAYQEMSAIIHEIIESDEVTEQIYVEKLAELEEFIARNERRRELIEKRTLQAAEGNARTLEAKGAAQRHLLAHLEEAKLPEDIYNFLINTWQPLMVMTHIKTGDESTEWLDATQLVQDLVWVCQPQQDIKSRQRFEKIEAELFTRIETSLKATITSEEELTDIVSSIKETIDTLHQQYKGETAEPDLKALTESLAKELGADSEKSWQEMSALERQQARHKALTYEYIKQAESLPLNTWVKYNDTKEGRIIRCKLADKIEASDTYIFVNRFGFKVMEKLRKDFAYDMQQQHVEPLNNTPLFERAMSTITGNLRELSAAETQ